MAKWNEKEARFDAEQNLIMTNISHKFALKMAVLICLSVVSTVVLYGLFLGTITNIALYAVGVVAIILGIISFSITRSACLL